MSILYQKKSITIKVSLVLVYCWWFGPEFGPGSNLHCLRFIQGPCASIIQWTLFTTRWYPWLHLFPFAIARHLRQKYELHRKYIFCCRNATSAAAAHTRRRHCNYSHVTVYNSHVTRRFRPAAGGVYEFPLCLEGDGRDLGRCVGWCSLERDKRIRRCELTADESGTRRRISRVLRVTGASS